MSIQQTTIGAVILVIGVGFIILNKYFVSYLLHLNKLFFKMLGVRVNIQSKLYHKYYCAVIYLVGILLIYAGYVIFVS